MNNPTPSPQFKTSDELLETLSLAQQLVRTEGTASISLLQRHFMLGFTDAKTLMQMLVDRGVVIAGDDGFEIAR